MKKVSLSPNEKADMLNRLNIYAEENPAVKSPYMFLGMNVRFSPAYAYVLSVLLVVLLVGGGTAFASKNTLPGDILYPMKVNIVEPLRVAFAGSAEARDRIKSEQVVERLKEVEELTVRERLASSTISNFSRELGTDIDSVRSRLNKKDKENFDVTLSAHAEVLKTVSEDSKPEAKSHSEQIQSVIVEKISKDVQDNARQDNVGRENASLMEIENKAKADSIKAERVSELEKIRNERNKDENKDGHAEGND